MSIVNFSSLQEGQDIFGVDFDYDEFEKYEEDDYEEEDDDLDDYIEDEDEGKRIAHFHIVFYKLWF